MTKRKPKTQPDHDQARADDNGMALAGPGPRDLKEGGAFPPYPPPSPPPSPPPNQGSLIGLAFAALSPLIFLAVAVVAVIVYSAWNVPPPMPAPAPIVEPVAPPVVAPPIVKPRPVVHHHRHPVVRHKHVKHNG